MFVQIGQQLLEFSFQEGDVGVVELDVVLDELTFVEEVAEKPVADAFVEAVQEGGADGHDSLKIFDFEGNSCDDSI